MHRNRASTLLLLAIAALSVGARNAAAQLSTSSCLEVDYRGAEPRGRDTLRVRDSVVYERLSFSDAPRTRYFTADLLYRGVLEPLAWWRPIGEDSVDLVIASFPVSAHVRIGGTQWPRFGTVRLESDDGGSWRGTSLVKVDTIACPFPNAPAR